MAGWSGWRLGAGALLQEAVQCLLMSKRSQNEAGALGKGSVWVGEGITQSLMAGCWEAQNRILCMELLSLL